jgi:bifunctional non-homologous end joining protein LigD
MVSRLSLYNRKRDFAVTPEPPGRVAKGSATKRRFVIQRHAATRLHYDLRLELNGVYKSWAVTKVPSLDPATKRLAVEVEDHPIDYGTFEGTIPQGEYGGGTVQLWDRGTWTSQSTGDPERDLARGNLKVCFDGKRMKGGWALVRLRDRDKGFRRNPRHNWLLIKEKDEDARPGDPEALASETTSVKTGRTLEEIASRSRNVWHSNRAEVADTREKEQSRARASAKPKSTPRKSAAPRAARKTTTAPAKKKRRR